MKRKEEVGYLINFDPGRETIYPPRRPEGLIKSRRQKWYALKEKWNIGQQRFLEMLRVNDGANSLGNFPWTHSSHDLTLRQVFEEVIGFKDSGGREQGGYKRLRETRSLLQIGDFPSTRKTPTGSETIYVFTSMELAQLIVGFLAATAREDHVPK